MSAVEGPDLYNSASLGAGGELSFEVKNPRVSKPLYQSLMVT